MTTTYVAPNAGEQLLVMIGNGDGPPETYSAPALINTTRSLKMTTTEKSTEIPRTDNPSAPAYVSRVVTAVDWSIEGAGVLNVGDDKTYADWLISGVAKDVQVSDAKTGGLVLSGTAVLTDFTIDGDRGGKIMCTLTLKGVGIPTTAAHA